ncbi:MAG TPA: hypothetical protein VN081_04815 [Dongiaceae bacterium]|nr:hypothetical protein [Dongiaceae bacterium]
MKIKIPVDLFFYANSGAEFLRRHITDERLLKEIIRRIKCQVMFLIVIFFGVYEIEKHRLGVEGYRVLTFLCALGFWWMCKGFPLPRRHQKPKDLPAVHHYLTHFSTSATSLRTKAIAAQRQTELLNKTVN